MDIEISQVILAAVTFITSVVSASMGFLGGTLLLTTMTQLVPLQALIPLHGTIQLWANGSRVFFLLKSVNKRIFLHYSIGSVVGAIIASQYIIQIDEGKYALGLGLFIITVTFMPKPEKGIVFPGKWILVGFIASWMGLFMGAVGTFVGAMFLSEKLDKKEMVGTQAACQSLLHLLKIVVFVYMGFKLWEWWGVLSVLVVMTILGSFVGTRILDKIPQATFIKILRGLILILSCKLIYDGLMKVFFPS